MTWDVETLEEFRSRLLDLSAASRERAAEELGDLLSPHLPRTAGHLAGARLLLEAAKRETDASALEAILNTLDRLTSERELPPGFPWREVGEMLPTLEEPTLQYGLGILGNAGDLDLLRLLEPYRDHPNASVRGAAAEAMEAIRLAADAEPRICACEGCEETAARGLLFCPVCDDGWHVKHPAAPGDAKE